MKFVISFILINMCLNRNVLFMLPLVCGQLALVSGYDIAMATLA